MSGVKRKRLVVTMEQKLKAIERLDKGESVKSISDELGVGVTTVNDWKRNKKSIQNYCTQIESEKILTSRCTLKKPTNKIVDDALWLWFTQERRKGTPISGPILKEKAMALHAEIENCGTFTASDGWLARWKKRHGIHFLSTCGEKLSADPGVSAGANAENAEEKQKQQMLRNIELSYPPVDSQFLTEDSNPSQTSESEPIASTSKLATLTSATVKPATVTSATVTSQVSQPKSLIQKSTVAEFSVIKKSTVDETAKLRETIKRLEEKNIQLQVENESYRVKNIMLETKQKKLIVQLKTIIQKKDPLYLGDSRLVYEQHSQRLTVSSASTTGSRTTTTLAGQGHDSDVGATQSQDFSDPDDPTDNTAFMDSLQPSDIDIDVGPIFETIEIKPNIELDNLPPPPPSPPPKRKRTAIPDIEVAEQEDPLATKRTRSSPLVGYGEDGDKEDDDNFSGDEFDEEEDGDKVRRAYQLLKSVFDKKDKYDIFGHRLAARLRALKSAKVCRHVLDIMESVIDDAEAGKYNNV
ncbi:tigger transposable element-derived protein 2 isoform X10 [Nilaparvata lugens]|uniref:tigger transposable element-derived protein 2 isoform X10 n=1 Tax=Nilaparvata lugens TaxID=108931 RepID=UPI00193E3386|nr:tigger transposable element-derived protein 2 isoform X10 [Nilaparvata lugens]